jgi:hypothetical protein
MPENTEKRRSLRWMIVVSASIAVIAISVLLIRPYFWTRAQYYDPQLTAAPMVPVMSMAEYDSVVGIHARPYVLRYNYKTSNGVENQLLIFGISDHTTDPENVDIKQIASLYDENRPDICLLESRLGIWFAGYNGIVKQFAESGALAWHARKTGVSYYTLELPLDEEMRRVAAEHNHDHTVLFYVLRPYFGQRRGGPIDDPDSAIAESLSKRTKIKGIDSSIETVADIDRVWKQDFADQKDWRDCDDEFGWPGALNDVGASANSVRNQHWLNVLYDLMAGESSADPQSIFAVVGCSHAVRLQPALDSLFQPDPANPNVTTPPLK